MNSTKEAVQQSFGLLLWIFTHQVFTSLVVGASLLFSLVKTAKLILPFFILAILYSVVLLGIIYVFYGPDIRVTFHDPVKSFKASLLTSIIVYFLGLVTPKKIRQVRAKH